MPLFLLGNRPLGQAGIKYYSDTSLCRESWVLVCPVCGDSWARVVDDPDNWVPLRLPCKKHSFPTSDCGGSFLPVWLKYIDALPPEVLRYEAQLRLEKADEFKE